MKPRFTDEHKYPYGYVSASATDITKTLDRARKRLKQQAEEQRVKVTKLPLADSQRRK